MPQLWPRKAKAKNKKTSVNLDNRVNSQHMECKPVESWRFVIYSAASNLEGEKKRYYSPLPVLAVAKMRAGDQSLFHVCLPRAFVGKLDKGA